MTTPSTIDLKLVARINKLHAMAESAREVGSLAEADSFMEAVEKTLAAHNLDSSVLTLDLKDLTDPLDRTHVQGTGTDPKRSRHQYARRPLEWVVDLGQAVAEAHFCASNFTTTSTRLFFYGRKTNRETAVRMFTYLRDMAERLAFDAMIAEERRRIKEYGSKQGAGAWRLNWLEGFVREVARRYRDMRSRVDQDRSMALVLVSVQKEARRYASGNVGRRWRDIIMPADVALSESYAGKSLWDISREVRRNPLGTFEMEDTDRLKVLIAFLRETPWPAELDKPMYIREAKELINFLDSPDVLSANRHSHAAQTAGAAAARDVNLRPNVVDGGASGQTRQIRRGA